MAYVQHIATIIETVLWLQNRIEVKSNFYYKLDYKFNSVH